MEKQNHTPGPWILVLDNHPNHRSIYVRTDSHGGNIAKVVATRDSSNDATWSQSRVEANARLIAAAPDLLAALERVTLQLAHEHTNDEAWVEARAAIAKATG